MTPDAGDPVSEVEQQAVQDEAAFQKAREAILELGHSVQATEELLTELWNSGIGLFLHQKA